MYRFSKEDIKRVRKVRKAEVKQIEEPINELPYMWEVPKAERMDLLLKKVGPCQFEGIYGKNKEDILAHRRKPKITVPEPFDLSENKGSKLRSIFVESWIQSEIQEEENAANFKLLKTRIPRSTFEKRYEKLKEREDLKKQFWKAQRNLTRR